MRIVDHGLGTTRARQQSREISLVREAFTHVHFNDKEEQAIQNELSDQRKALKKRRREEAEVGRLSYHENVGSESEGGGTPRKKGRKSKTRGTLGDK